MDDVECTHALYLMCREELTKGGSKTIPVPPPRKRDGEKWRHFRKGPRPTSIAPPQPCDDLDSTDMLAGASIVFTGELSVSRSEASQAATEAGATVRTSISKTTTYLVRGDMGEMADADGMCSKEREARKMVAEKGTKTKIIDEDAFNELLKRKGAVYGG